MTTSLRLASVYELCVAQILNWRKAMKKICTLILCFLIISLCIGCTNKPDDPYDIENNDPYHIRNEGGFNVYVSKRIARYSTDDGWVFTFIQNSDKTGDDSDIVKYQFFGINIRYRFQEAFTKILSQTLDDGTVVYQRYTPAIMLWGQGSDAQQHDMEIVSNLLTNDRTIDELLEISADDFDFWELDGSIFVNLVHTALTDSPQKEGTDLSYWEKPTYAFLVEPNYVDNYKFQICFLQETGGVDELYIDVLYKTGDNFNEYIQLSDLVEKGNATIEQQNLYDMIQQIVQGIKRDGNFLANEVSYKDLVLAGVNLSRLNTFLDNIHDNNLTPYQEDPIVEVIEGN